MSAAIVEVRDLHKSFAKVHAVQGVSFDIEPAQVVGFIGANGAGKTTTMRLMATLDIPDAGTIRIDGYDALNYPAQVRRRIGWMPESYGTYEHMTVLEYLDFYARAYGFGGGERRERIAEVIEFTDLTGLADRPMKGLSKGMGQRLCLGRTLLHDPGILILDEPAAGLDPRARIEFKRLVRLLAEDGKAVFISSHILSELGEMCDTMLFIDEGRIVHYGTPESLKAQAALGILVRIETAAEPSRLREWIDLHPGIELVNTERHGCRARLTSQEPADAADVLARMVRDGIPVTEFHREEARLEDAFVDLLAKIEGNRRGNPPQAQAPAQGGPQP